MGCAAVAARSKLKAAPPCVSASCPVYASKPSETSERLPSAARPPTATTAVALVAPTPPWRPVSGKGGLTLVHVMPWQAVAPGRLEKPEGQGVHCARDAAPGLGEKVFAGQSEQASESEPDSM